MVNKRNTTANPRYASVKRKVFLVPLKTLLNHGFALIHNFLTVEYIWGSFRISTQKENLVHGIMKLDKYRYDTDNIYCACTVYDNYTEAVQ
jgi:predicted TIM-barrel enzyme